MFTFKVNDREYKLKFGYKPTIKAKILSKLAKVSTEDVDDVTAIEKSLELLPELILVGLQVSHSDEFGYDYDTNEGWNEKLDSVYDLVEEYLGTEGSDFQMLFEGVQDELMNDGFLANLFRQEVVKEEKTKQRKSSTTKK